MRPFGTMLYCAATLIKSSLANDQTFKMAVFCIWKMTPHALLKTMLRLGTMLICTPVTSKSVVLIGIGAIVLFGARIGRGSIIGAGAVILENSNIPPFSLVVGCPEKIIKKTPEDTIENQKKWAQKYVELSKVYKAKFSSP